MEEFVTACPRNCYSSCSFRVQVENNKIRRILPYSENLATPEGPCIKGLSYIERTHSPERIIYPLIKTSQGRFQQITINEALDIISYKLNSVREKYGPKSILWYKGSGMSGLTNEIGYSFWKVFGGTTITYGNLCWPAGLEAVRLTLGSVKHNVPWDLKNAKTIIIWGKNPAETNIQETVQEPAVGISPGDAAKRNIYSGHKIRVFNQTGEIISVARISNRIPAGLVVLPNGIWYNEGGGGNHLITGRETDMGYGAAFHDNTVEVERVD